MCRPPSCFTPVAVFTICSHTLQANALYVVFTQAERLKPEGWKENRLFLAKCYIGLWDYATAVAWLDRADAIPMAMPDVREGVKDKLSQKEVEDLLSRYSSYRAKK